MHDPRIVAFQLFHVLRQRLLTRCAGCGGRSSRSRPVNQRGSGDTPRTPWWCGSVGLYHQECRPLGARPKQGTFFSAELDTPAPTDPAFLPEGWDELGWSSVNGTPAARWCARHERVHAGDDFGALCRAWDEANKAERARLRMWMPWRRLWR